MQSAAKQNCKSLATISSTLPSDKKQAELLVGLHPSAAATNEGLNMAGSPTDRERLTSAVVKEGQQKRQQCSQPSLSVGMIASSPMSITKHSNRLPVDNALLASCCPSQ